MVEIRVELWDESPLKGGEIVVDVETRNDLGKLDWDYSRAELSMCGFLLGKEITIFCKEDNETDIVLFESITEYFNRYKNCDFYAFNKNMENGSLRVNFIQEIQPYHGKGCNLKMFYDELRKAKLCPEVLDVLEGRSFKCIEYWNSGDKKKRDIVVKHNIADLKREAFVHVNRQFLKEGKDIDERNWLRQ